MRLRGDDFVSYTIICRVCAAGTHAFVEVKFPRACRLRRHTPYARNPPAVGFALQGRGFVNCKQLLEIAIGNAVFLRIGAQMAADFPFAVIKKRGEKCLQYFFLVIIKVKILRLGRKDKVFFVFLRLLY